MKHSRMTVVKTELTEYASYDDSGVTGRTGPKTGDNTNLWLPIVLMIGAAGLAGGILCGSKKKKKQNKQDKKAD